MNARSFRVVVAVAGRRALAEPGGLLVTGGFYLVVVATVSSLWRAASSANQGGVAGYSAAALTWYIAASEAATVSLNVRLIEDVGNQIGSGAVAVELLRPASVLGIRMSAEVGRALPRLVVCMAAGATLCTLLVGGPPDAVAVALAVPALVLAIICNLLAQHAFAAISFWIRDARSAWFLYQKFVFIVGGMLLPLEVLPDGLEAVAKALPFMAMAYVPGRLAAGHLEPELLLVQLAWLGVLGGLAAAAFAAGERRRQVLGG